FIDDRSKAWAVKPVQQDLSADRHQAHPETKLSRSLTAPNAAAEHDCRVLTPRLRERVVAGPQHRPIAAALEPNFDLLSDSYTRCGAGSRQSADQVRRTHLPFVLDVHRSAESRRVRP